LWLFIRYIRMPSCCTYGLICTYSFTFSIYLYYCNLKQISSYIYLKINLMYCVCVRVRYMCVKYMCVALLTCTVSTSLHLLLRWVIILIIEHRISVVGGFEQFGLYPDGGRVLGCSCDGRWLVTREKKIQMNHENMK